MKKLRIGGVPEHFNLPWRRLVESGELEAVGFDASWQAFASGTGALCEALDRHEIDLALLLTEGACAHLATSPSRAALVGTYVSSPLRWGLHVHHDAPIYTTDDLRGRPFAISRLGSGSHLMATLLAHQRGWPPPSLQQVGSLQGAIDALNPHDAQCFMWEVTMTSPLVDDATFRLIDTFSAPWPAFLIAAQSPSFFSRRDLQAILTPLKAHADALRLDTARTLDATRQEYGLATHTAQDWLDHTRWDCSTHIDHLALNRALDALHQVQPHPNTHPDVTSLTLQRSCAPWTHA